jgi:hypothetical protein
VDYYSRIAALVGTIIFLVSAFLPLIIVPGFSWSLVDEYQNIGSMDWYSFFASYPVSALGLLLLVILWPLAMGLCVASIFRRKIGLVAGVVGIVCWVGAVMYVMGVNPASGFVQYGAGIFVGFAGAIILLVAYYVKPKLGTVQTAPSQVAPPPPPPSATVPLCQTCGQPLTFIQQYGRWYCYNCNKYP